MKLMYIIHNYINNKIVTANTVEEAVSQLPTNKHTIQKRMYDNIRLLGNNESTQAKLPHENFNVEVICVDVDKTKNENEAITHHYNIVPTANVFDTINAESAEEALLYFVDNNMDPDMHNYFKAVPAR